METKEIKKEITIRADKSNRMLCGHDCEHQSKHKDPNNLCYLFFKCERKKQADSKFARTPQCKSVFGNQRGEK